MALGLGSCCCGCSPLKTCDLPIGVDLDLTVTDVPQGSCTCDSPSPFTAPCSPWTDTAAYELVTISGVSYHTWTWVGSDPWWVDPNCKPVCGGTTKCEAQRFTLYCAGNVLRLRTASYLSLSDATADTNPYGLCDAGCTAFSIGTHPGVDGTCIAGCYSYHVADCSSGFFLSFISGSGKIIAFSVP